MNMKYLSLDEIDISSSPYPSELKSISITIRGTKRLFDIFFAAADVETSFNINIPSNIDFTWVNTPSGKEKYLTYPSIKKVLFRVNDDCGLGMLYLAWIDSLLFCDAKSKTFFCRSLSKSIDDSTEDTISDIDDTESISSYDSICGNDHDYVMTSMKYKVDQLENKLELKNKDIIILEREVQLRDKEIELLRLKISLLTKSSWI